MQHIKQAMANIIENSSKAKFFRGNRDLFLKYFDSHQQYEALILAGNFKKMKEIVEEQSTFKSDKWINEFLNNDKNRPT